MESCIEAGFDAVVVKPCKSLLSTQLCKVFLADSSDTLSDLLEKFEAIRLQPNAPKDN